MRALDRIEKHILLRAPLGRIWNAISDAKQFGSWFGIELEGDFVVGKAVIGTFNKEIDRESIMEHQRRIGVPPSGIRIPDKDFVFCTVERIEPQRFFSFRWIPFGIDADVDLRSEPTTLVEFEMQESKEGTLLTIIESGFEQVPEHRRKRAFLMNEGGWAIQVENIKQYVEKV